MTRSVVAVFACTLHVALLSVAAQTSDKGEPIAASTTVFDVLAQHGNSQRTGSYLSETILTPDRVQSGSFGRLFQWEVDGQIYGQPLYVSHIQVGGRMINMLFVTTMNNSIYAFEAPGSGSDTQPSAYPIWHVGNDVLGKPLPSRYFHMKDGIFGHNIEPLIGIVASPVIDRIHNRIFVTVKYGKRPPFAFHSEAHYGLFAFNLVTGDKINNVEIKKGQYKASNGSVGTFDPKFQLQRASLLEANDRVYLAFGSHQDTPPYHGWLMAYDAMTLQPISSYCVTCGHSSLPLSNSGGIWQAGGGAASDSEGNIYVMTGNGSFDSSIGDLGTSFIKFDKDLKVLGSWTPPNHDCLNRTDSDLGSAGPLLLMGQVPTSPVSLIGGGKEGLLYSIDSSILDRAIIGAGKPANPSDSLIDPCGSADVPEIAGSSRRGYSTVQAAPLWQKRFIIDILRVAEPEIVSQGFHHIHGAPVYWKVHDDTSGDRSIIYISAERDLIRGFEWDGKFLHASPPGVAPLDTFHSRCPNSDWGMPGGFLTISADGTDPRSGVVWAAMPRRDKDALRSVVTGVLRAYRAYPEHGEILEEIWNSDQGANPHTNADCADHTVSTPTEELGLFAKYVPPTVSEGKVYMATFSNSLAVYGLRNATASAAANMKGYNSSLTSDALPKTVEPSSVIKVSVSAVNTGSTIWHASDRIRLGSPSTPQFRDEVVDGTSALLVNRDVLPGQTYTFSFRIRAAHYEGTYYHRWRLVLSGRTSKQLYGDWFGGASGEWQLSVQRSACVNLRAEANDIARDIARNTKISETISQRIENLREKAEKRDCRISDHVMAADGASH
jgi:hypothetical protein